ncbi:hypothetical protein [Glaciibacter flavus]|uniref:hypothetical protein n=1 Tax=Orlajensenia flava TaxID=2565934 RepID=UPI003AFF9107
MNAALLPTTALSPNRSAGLAGAAVRLGRAIELWGVRRASDREDRDALLLLMESRRCAERALAERDETWRASSFGPLC